MEKKEDEDRNQQNLLMFNSFQGAVSELHRAYPTILLRRPASIASRSNAQTVDSRLSCWMPVAQYTRSYPNTSPAGLAISIYCTGHFHPPGMKRFIFVSENSGLEQKIPMGP